MNKFAALALATVLLVASAALFVAGEVVPAVIALVISLVFDVLFVRALRDERTPRKST